MTDLHTYVPTPESAKPACHALRLGALVGHDIYPRVEGVSQAVIAEYRIKRTGDLMTRRELAGRLGVHRGTVDRWLRSGNLPLAVKWINGRPFVCRNDAEAYLASLHDDVA